MTHRVEFSARARKDFGRLDRTQKKRIGARIEELAANPADPRISAVLASPPGLRKSRVGGWRIIFTVDDANKLVQIVTIARRGQVYKRL